MKSLLLIRHGQAEHQVTPLTGGWTNTDLTELGRQQASLLATRLRQELEGVPARILCSDLQRTAQTGELLSWELGLRLQFAPALREFNNGTAAGKTMEEAKQLLIPPTDPILEWHPYPEAESWREFYFRVAGYMQGITADQQELLVLVTHGGTINCIVTWWLQLRVEWLEQIKISFDASPASITVLNVNDWGEHSVERFNDTAHLYTGGVSEKIKLV